MKNINLLKKKILTLHDVSFYKNKFKLNSKKSLKNIISEKYKIYNFCFYRFSCFFYSFKCFRKN